VTTSSGASGDERRYVLEVRESSIFTSVLSIIAFSNMCLCLRAIIYVLDRNAHLLEGIFK
jgi:hypothetical protein